MSVRVEGSRFVSGTKEKEVTIYKDANGVRLQKNHPGYVEVLMGGTVVGVHGPAYWGKAYVVEAVIHATIDEADA